MVPPHRGSEAATGLKRALRVAVVGAGLGGLAAAIALARRGIEVRVFEQASSFGDAGAGIQISPNAVKVLRALGLEHAMRRAAFEPLGFLGRDWKSARVVFRSPLKEVFTSMYGAGYYQLHRADLHRLLCEALPESWLLPSARCVAVRSEASTASVRFADGSEAEADAVIGADGIHSEVRNSILGRDRPRFTGCVCWRALVPSAHLPKGLVPPMAANWLGPGGHVVHYFIRGGELLNVVAIRETADWTAESWTIPSTREEMLMAFSGWHPGLLEVLSRVELVFKWGLFDREPLERWSEDRITLLGDAAHAMLPFLAQGAAMAIEDAYVLAEELARQPVDLPAAFRVYEAERRPRTARAQLGARERRFDLHAASAWEQVMRNVGYRWRELRDPTSNSFGGAWLYAHDVTAKR